jgi:hypothetical protein
MLTKEEQEKKDAEDAAAKIEVEKKTAEEAEVAKKLVEEEETKKKEEEEEEENDPYTIQLKKIEAEKAKLSDENRQKAGALVEEKKKRGALEQRLVVLEEKIAAGSGSIDEAKLVERLKAEIGREDKVKSLSSNPKEQALIRELMVAKNLSAEDAYVLANKHIVDQYKEQEANTDGEEIILARLSGGGPAGGVKVAKSAILKAAADGLSAEEAKHLETDE